MYVAGVRLNGVWLVVVFAFTTVCKHFSIDATIAYGGKHQEIKNRVFGRESVKCSGTCKEVFAMR